MLSPYPSDTGVSIVKIPRDRDCYRVSYGIEPTGAMQRGECGLPEFERRCLVHGFGWALHPERLSFSS